MNSRTISINGLKTNSHSPEETMQMGIDLASKLEAGSVVCFFGNLGSGKTTFIRGLLTGLGVEEDVTSPTYTYLTTYNATHEINHFDLYRLDDHSAFSAMGFDEHLDPIGITCIEWAERITPLLPQSALRIHLEHPQ